MAERLQILGPCRWWTEGVRSGRYSATPTSGSSTAWNTVSAAIVLGPEVADEAAFDRWRDRAEPWIGPQLPGVLALLGVERVDRRTAWVYEDCDGVSMGVAMAAEVGPLPLRVGAQVVARCAEILEPLAAAGQIHPGPDPHDVLLRPDGSVVLAGFVGPFAQSPIHREPRGAEDATAVVWRLGVLLAEALTGTRPHPAADRVAHDLMLRRLLIRIMSRPGPMFPERYRDWLCGMLSWDAEARPLLSRVAPGLRELASTLPSPDLTLWSARRIPELRGRGLIEPLAMTDPPLDPGPGDLATQPTADRTEEAELTDTPEIDDATAVSADGDPPRRVFLTPEHGTIPVQVGPPPEAVPRPTRLPDELFRTPQGQPRLDLTDGSDRRTSWTIAGVCAVLFVLALLLSWYLWD